MNINIAVGVPWPAVETVHHLHDHDDGGNQGHFGYSVVVLVVSGVPFLLARELWREGAVQGQRDRDHSRKLLRHHVQRG